jgi:leucyl/phenylalanyl-tRNA--protein transferase
MLLSAYRQGMFPWFTRDGSPFWFSPDPRFVLIPSELHIGNSLRKILKKRVYEVTFDTAFSEVMRHCSETPRPGQDGTWITDDFLQGYGELHSLGIAHSVEAWLGEGDHRHLVGGLYGLLLGRVFFGESMFSHQPNASKVAFVTWVEQLVKSHGVELIDCQAPTAYLSSFGAKEVSREWFLEQLREGLPH